MPLAAQRGSDTVARFASRHRNFRHGARVGEEMVLANGKTQVLEKHLAAAFVPAPQILSEDEIKYALDNLVFNGLPIDKNTNSYASPRIRLSGFDTERAQKEQGWSDEEREVVESRLRGSEVFGMDFIEIPPARVQKPWATYDETPIAKLVGLIEAVGMSYEDVLAYEKQNQNRDSVLVLLEDALGHTNALRENDETGVVIEA